MNTESVNPDFRPALCGVLIHNAAVGRLIPLILFIADDCGENCNRNSAFCENDI